MRSTTIQRRLEPRTLNPLRMKQSIGPAKPGWALDCIIWPLLESAPMLRMDTATYLAEHITACYRWIIDSRDEPQANR